MEEKIYSVTWIDSEGVVRQDALNLKDTKDLISDLWKNQIVVFNVFELHD